MNDLLVFHISGEQHYGKLGVNKEYYSRMTDMKFTPFSIQ